ncbi:hypothetical protein EE612_012204 [Oryza sativa]|nr:hypothetical protein EE612_012204 [Oryza sativa]
MALSTAFSALPTSPADVRVVTADGSGIRAHSSVLASASPVLERMIEQAPRGGVVPIAGASTGAVVVFLRFLYAGGGGGGGGVGGGGAGGARGGADGAGARVPCGGPAEAARGGGGGGAGGGRGRGGRDEAGGALRRAAPVPAVRAARRQGARGGPGVRGLALRRAPRRRAPGRPAPADPRRRPEEGEVGEGAGLPGRVPAAQRRHGRPGARLRPRRPRIATAAAAAAHRPVLQDGLPLRAPAGPPAAREALLRRLRQESRRRLHALPALLPAPPATLLRLRQVRRRFLRSSPLQQLQD